MSYRAALLGGLITCLVSRLPAGNAEGAAPRPRSALAEAKGLDRPISVSEAKIPLGELVQRVADETGVPLTAARDVVDEPVAVAVTQLPARELLDELAELLDYQWSRRGNERERRYEIWQDLASKQREEALREALVREAEKRFREELKLHAEIAALPPAEFERLTRAAQKHWEEWQRLSPEQREARLKTPEEQERNRRFSAAASLRSPIARSLAGLLQPLPAPRWVRLREGRELVFSTHPKPGELRLPLEAERRLRAARPTWLPFGARLAFPNPEEEERLRRLDQGLQEAWAAASEFRVTLRLNTDRLRTQGALSLNANAIPLRDGEPLGAASLPPVGGHSGTAFFLFTAPPALATPAEDETPERRAALRKDPVVGVPRSVKPAVKPAPSRNGPAAPGWWTLRDLLPDLARAYGVHFIADAYWTSSPGLEAGSIPAEPIALHSLLDRAAKSTHRWDRRENLIRLRSRTWFLDRPREVPLRMVRRWQELIARRGALPLESYVEMVTGLGDPRLDTLSLLDDVLDLPLDLSTVQGSRHALRLYAALAPAQRRELWQGEAIPMARMTPGQRELAATALKESLRVPRDELDPRHLAAGSFFQESERLIRVHERRAGRARYEEEPAMAPGNTPPMPRQPVPGAAAPAGSAGAVTRHAITRVRFQCRYGPEIYEIGYLTLASPEGTGAAGSIKR